MQLVSLSPLGDMSRYVRKENKVPVHGTALFVLDGSVVECSGVVLAARSPILEQHLVSSYEIVLEDYLGGIYQLRQVKLGALKKISFLLS